VLDIIYKDDHLVAVNKPSGLLVHRSLVDSKEKIFALQMIRNQVRQYVFPVHRLDRPTSGVLLFALSAAVAKQTSVLFQTNQITKIYLAVVRGFIPDSGIIDYPLKPVKDRRIFPYSVNNTKKAISAVTEFIRLETVELSLSVDKYPTTRYSLAKLIPKTGRRHQLRRHMKHLAHPIIGDTKYGKGVHNRFFINRLNCSGLMLAAHKMIFNHPVTGSKIVIQAPLNKNFIHIMKSFNWNNS